MLSLMERNPEAFRPKLEAEQHAKGCNCRKSGCLKKNIVSAIKLAFPVVNTASARSVRTVSKAIRKGKKGKKENRKWEAIEKAMAMIINRVYILMVMGFIVWLQ